MGAAVTSVPTTRTLMLVGGGVEAVSAVHRARELGLRVVVSDGDPEAPASKVADERLVASTYDIDATVSAAKASHARHPIHGVLCVATDVPLTVASVARALGLPGLSIETATLSMDKLAMKERFRSAGVPIPWFARVHSAADLQQIVTARGFPLVLKPVDSRGARGVLRLRAGVDLAWAFAESQRHSPTGRVMVEAFLSGPQVSTESLVIEGVVSTPGFADRNYEYLDRFAPYIIENGGELPSRLDEATQEAVREVVVQAAAAMGVRNGVVKGDIVVHEGRAYIIEVATRLSGGYFCTHTIPFSTGVDLLGHAMRVALGDAVDPQQLVMGHERPIVQRYWFPAPGRVTAIEGLAPYLEHPDVVYLEMRVRVGDVVRPIDSHPARPAVVMTTGTSRDAALALAERIVRDVIIRTE